MLFELNESSSEDIFVDALEHPTLPDSISLELSISETRLGLDLFLENRFNEATQRLLPYSKKSMYHALATGTLYYLEAASTFDQEKFNEASAFIKSAKDVCSKYRHKGDGLFSFGSSNKEYTEIEAHAELGYAESLLELALINIMQDENMVTFLQSSLKIRECYYCYKHCLGFINKVHWNNSILRKEFECGVYFGLGAFNLMISLLPQRALKLLEFVGFSGDKNFGLSLLKQASQMTKCLRAPMCGLMLLLYYNYVTHLLNIEREEDKVESEILLKIWLNKYDNSALFLFFAGRFSLISLNAKLHFNNSIAAQNEWMSYHHLCYWELMWCHAIQGEWLEAINYAERLACESRWSQVSYRYMKAVFIIQLLDDQLKPNDTKGHKQNILPEDSRHAFKNQVKELMQCIPEMLQRFAGKSLPMEKFAVKKSKRFLQQNHYLAIPALEIIYVWNAFKLLKNNHDALERFIKIAKNSLEYTLSTTNNVDDICLAQLLCGVCYYYLGRIEDAENKFLDIIEDQRDLKEDSYLIPYTFVELARICLDKKQIDEAEALLERAHSCKKYNLENRLHFKMHALRAKIKELKNPGSIKSDWWTRDPENIAETLINFEEEISMDNQPCFPNPYSKFNNNSSVKNVIVCSKDPCGSTPEKIKNKSRIISIIRNPTKMMRIFRPSNKNNFKSVAIPARVIDNTDLNISH